MARANKEHVKLRIEASRFDSIFVESTRHALLTWLRDGSDLHLSTVQQYVSAKATQSDKSGNYINVIQW